MYMLLKPSLQYFHICCVWWLSKFPFSSIVIRNDNWKCSSYLCIFIFLVHETVWVFYLLVFMRGCENKILWIYIPIQHETFSEYFYCSCMYFGYLVILERKCQKIRSTTHFPVACPIYTLTQSSIWSLIGFVYNICYLCFLPMSRQVIRRAVLSWNQLLNVFLIFIDCFLKLIQYHLLTPQGQN
jgi:hypothetical protein